MLLILSWGWLRTPLALLTANLTTTSDTPIPISSVRIFEGIRDKAPDDQTYDYVVEQLRGTIDELQLSLPEELGF